QRRSPTKVSLGQIVLSWTVMENRLAGMVPGIGGGGGAGLCWPPPPQAMVQRHARKSDSVLILRRCTKTCPYFTRLEKTTSGATKAVQRHCSIRLQMNPEKPDGSPAEEICNQSCQTRVID